ncbi:hypothetical protein EVAR_89746_1 [Eumeta japonica]|uniref:Secreted protein n=1 Tax=Eumeta variegata TaxID=151549 RepID=A0A4C1Y2I7_EUMVA|nr:hypothetical protein EVAR_89746_1 [Eumeta japonica]
MALKAVLFAFIVACACAERGARVIRRGAGAIQRPSARYFILNLSKFASNPNTDLPWIARAARICVQCSLIIEFNCLLST